MEEKEKNNLKIERHKEHKGTIEIVGIHVNINNDNEYRTTLPMGNTIVFRLTIDGEIKSNISILDCYENYCDIKGCRNIYGFLCTMCSHFKGIDFSEIFKVEKK